MKAYIPITVEIEVFEHDTDCCDPDCAYCNSSVDRCEYFDSEIEDVADFRSNTARYQRCTECLGTAVVAK